MYWARHPRLNAVMLALSCLATAGGCCTASRRAEIERETFDRVFFDTMNRVRSYNSEQAAWWFKPYYAQIVRNIDRTDMYALIHVLHGHGRAYAVLELEPYLGTEEGEKLKRIAFLVYTLSYRLHPGAEKALRSFKADDYLVQEGLLGYAFEDEAARKEANVPPAKWSTLGRAEKWNKLRAAWVKQGSKFEEKTNKERSGN